MWDRITLKENAKTKLAANYWPLVLMALIYSVFEGLSSLDIIEELEQQVENGLLSYDVFLTLAPMLDGLEIILVLLNYLVFRPFSIGCIRYFIHQEDGSASWDDLLYGFRENYLNVVKICFLQDLFTFLWTLCFIIPGIIKAYEYHMIPYLLAEDAHMERADIFNTTFHMMDGNKWDTFVLGLSFFGWYLLSSFTFGILSIFYVNPYYYLTFTEQYLALSSRNTPPVATPDADYMNNALFNNDYNWE